MKNAVLSFLKEYNDPWSQCLCKMLGLRNAMLEGNLLKYGMKKDDNV
jgi:hypothetical protein